MMDLLLCSYFWRNKVMMMMIWQCLLRYESFAFELPLVSRTLLWDLHKTDQNTWVIIICNRLRYRAVYGNCPLSSTSVWIEGKFLI